MKKTLSFARSAWKKQTAEDEAACSKALKKVNRAGGQPSWPGGHGVQKAT